MRSARIDPPGAYLRYIDFPGPEVPIVYMHGLGCTSTTDYAVVATRPALSRHRHLLIDFFGHGYSDAPDDFGYTLEELARSFGSVLDQLGVRECVLFGHSMGGAAAITLAALRPELVRNLILAESNLDPGGGFVSRDMSAREPHAVAELVELLLKDGRVSITRIATFRAASPVGLQRSAAGLVAGTVPTMRERLYAMNIPRTHIFGEKNLPDPETEEMKAHGINVLVVPKAGHDMPFENPEGLAEQIGAALRPQAANRQSGVRRAGRSRSGPRS